MIVKKKQYYGIKFPFTNEDDENFYVDLNKDEVEYVRSQVYQLIFTPKGRRFRRPEYGTDFLKYIFNPNDSESWAVIKNEICDTVGRFVKGVSIEEITVSKNEKEPYDAYVYIKFLVKRGYKPYEDAITVTL